MFVTLFVTPGKNTLRQFERVKDKTSKHRNMDKKGDVENKETREREKKKKVPLFSLLAAWDSCLVRFLLVFAPCPFSWLYPRGIC